MSGFQEDKTFYRDAAAHVFANNPKHKDAYAKDPESFAKSVEEKFQELKQQYRKFALALGPVGASMPTEDIKERTDLRDLVARLAVDFPYWERLHSMWHTDPDLNPYAPSPTLESIDEKLIPVIELECKKLEAHASEQLTLRARYENETARVNAGTQLESLKHQERVLQMQHQREREKEAHQLRALELQWRSENMASGSGLSMRQAPAAAHTTVPHTQFRKPN